MTRKQLARRLASRYERPDVRTYAHWKVRFDPAYAAVLRVVRERDQPLIDLGCGVGLLAFFLREEGFTAPIIGVDFDQRKIEIARNASATYRSLAFHHADAREALPATYDVVMVDLLQYFDVAAQQEILRNVRDAVPVGGAVIVRQGLRDDSWRYRVTSIVDEFARSIRWMQAENLHYPTREEIMSAFAGFESTVTPLWGRLPYNNYFFVFRRSA